MGGNKAQLIDRIIGDHNIVTDNGKDKDAADPSPLPTGTVVMNDDVVGAETTQKMSKARAFAESKGKELIDVTDYLEDTEKGKQFKKSHIGDVTFTTTIDYDDTDYSSIDSDSSSLKTWVDEVRMVEGCEGRAIIVGSLSRTAVTTSYQKWKELTPTWWPPVTPSEVVSPAETSSSLSTIQPPPPPVFRGGRRRRSGCP